MVIIDDATNRCLAGFYRAETAEAALVLFCRWVKRHGLLQSLYVDRHSIYRDEDHPHRPTQFGRASKKYQGGKMDRDGRISRVREIEGARDRYVMAAAE